MNAHRFRLVGVDHEGNDLRKHIWSEGWVAQDYARTVINRGGHVYGIEQSDDGGSTWFRI